MSKTNVFYLLLCAIIIPSLMLAVTEATFSAESSDVPLPFWSSRLEPSSANPARPNRFRSWKGVPESTRRQLVGEDDFGPLSFDTHLVMYVVFISVNGNLELISNLIVNVYAADYISERIDWRA